MMFQVIGQIDRWTKLFKATTWEEIKMIANGNLHVGEGNIIIVKMEYFGDSHTGKIHGGKHAKSSM